MALPKEFIRKAEIFKALHQKHELLILPNIWDPLGALLLEDLGYPAVATSSSAVALTQGFHDGEHLPFSDLLKQLTAITKAVSVPVTADIEKGYAENDEQLEQNIEVLIRAGVSGINFEDSLKEGNGLVPADVQARKIALIRKVADRMGCPLFINARIDTYIRGDLFSHEEKRNETLRREKIYREAGADGIFPILLTDLDHIKAIAAESDLPVNIMAFPGIPDLPELQAYGVKRVSLGSGLLTYGMQAMKDVAQKLMKQEGLSDIIENDLKTRYLDRLIER